MLAFLLAAASTAEAFSSACNATLQPTTAFTGATKLRQQKPVETAESCCELCAAASGCVSFTWHADNQLCVLKASLANKIKHESGSTSGICRGGGGPSPPTPTPPTPPGPAPSGIGFSAGFSSGMVLQRAPAKAAMYGFAPSGTKLTLVISDDTDGSNAEYSVATTASAGNTWKMFLRPTTAGGSHTATLSAGTGAKIVLSDVTFGDVYVCSGQSNMALTIEHTFSANYIRNAVQKERKYSNVRFFQYGGMQANASLLGFANRFVTALGSITEDPVNMRWFNLSQSMQNQTAGNENDVSPKPLSPPFDSFSATCMYFGTELADARAAIDGADATPIPIGLIQSAVGGSIIEAWVANATLDAACVDQFPLPAPGKSIALQHIPGALYYGMITPFVNTTVAGFTWYQGENNCGGTMGSPLTKNGYSCEMETLVRSWREIWSVVAGTTPSLAPFGIATLANSGSEGHSNKMATMRWAQQSNYGRWNNPALPNTFGAQLYDVSEPWANVGDGDKPNGNGTGYLKCCYVPPGADAKDICPTGKGAKKRCNDVYNCSLPSPVTGKYGDDCVDVWSKTSSLWSTKLKNVQGPIHDNSPSGEPANMFMGPIHPRLKRPVGRRLAVALLALNGESKGAQQGPTLASCAVAGTTLTLSFNETLLGNEKLMLRPYEANMSEWMTSTSSSGNTLYKTDSVGLMVCTVNGTWPPPSPDANNGRFIGSQFDPVDELNASTCGCLEWDILDRNKSNGGMFRFCAVGPGWKPTAYTGKTGGKDPSNPFAVQWTAVPLVQGAGATVTADLRKLNGQTPLAVRIGWPLFSQAVSKAKADDGCCTSQEYLDGKEPCIPGNCPLYTSESELVVNPFFATIGLDGRCRCRAPQVC